MEQRGTVIFETDCTDTNVRGLAEEIEYYPYFI